MLDLNQTLRHWFLALVATQGVQLPSALTGVHLAADTVLVEVTSVQVKRLAALAEVQRELAQPGFRHGHSLTMINQKMGSSKGGEQQDRTVGITFCQRARTAAHLDRSARVSSKGEMLTLFCRQNRG